MSNRKNVSELDHAQRQSLRQLLDQYINDPTTRPVEEHRAAGDMSTPLGMALMIHGDGFLTWHQHFLAELETWLVMNGGGDFVPLPYWDPAKDIPAELDNGNTSPHLPVPPNLHHHALKHFHSYKALNDAMLPYHGLVHDNAGGQMPDPERSPGDPIFWPFHALLVSIYEQWRL